MVRGGWVRDHTWSPRLCWAACASSNPQSSHRAETPRPAGVWAVQVLEATKAVLPLTININKVFIEIKFARTHYNVALSSVEKNG